MSNVTPIPTARKVCASCAFHAMETMQGQIMRQMICHRMPPTVSMVATPQGIQGMTLFPVVQPSMYCFEWQSRELLEAAENEAGQDTSANRFVEHIRRTVPVKGEGSAPAPAQAPDIIDD